MSGQAVDIHIINDRAFNAFVVDGHNMFIHAGALMDAKTPNQIIGVIAHESGHITGGHLARLQKPNLAGEVRRVDAPAARARRHGGRRCRGPADLGQLGMGAAYGGTDAAMRMVLAYRQDEESSADQAAVTFLNATHQSARGLLETLEFMNSKLFGVQGINPYLQSHPLPPQRLAQLRTLAEASPYFDVKDPPELQVRHDLVKAKLFGFLDQPETTFNRYPSTDRSLPAAYARAIATYRKSGAQAAMPQLDALIAAKPDWPYFYEIKGQFLFESGNAADAIPPLQKAVALAPEESLIRILLAQSMLAMPGMKNVDDAISNLRTALARETTSATGYRQLGAGLRPQGRRRQGRRREAGNIWRKPSLRRPRPISMKGG